MADYLKYNELYHSALRSNELMHHGIKGQKWGIRRFQNEDGTLTEEGKSRYLKTFAKPLKQTYMEREKFVKEFEQNPIILKAKQDIETINSKNVELHKKLKDFNRSLDIMISDYDDDLEVYWDNSKKDIAGKGVDVWRKDLKEIYLEFTKNPENLKNLEEYSNNHKQISAVKQKVLDTFIPKEVRDEHNKIPKNIPLSKLTKDETRVANLYFNYLDAITRSMKLPEQEYFAYGDLDRGPAPKEYLDRLDLWYRLQAFD